MIVCLNLWNSNASQLSQNTKTYITFNYLFKFLNIFFLIKFFTVIFFQLLVLRFENYFILKVNYPTRLKTIKNLTGIFGLGKEIVRRTNAFYLVTIFLSKDIPKNKKSGSHPGADALLSFFEIRTYVRQ